MTEPSPATVEKKRRTVAVIDIGATAIRMVIAEVDDAGGANTLESLHRASPLGKDTFTRGRIQQATIQTCVDILKDYRKVMEEYGVTDPAQVRAVATSSVREAENGDTFINRVYIATGIPVRAIDEAEESRLTYLAVQDLLRENQDIVTGHALIVEVGGGSTELLLLQGGHVAFSTSYRLGALRMRQTLETYKAPGERVKTILGQHIERTMEQMKRDLPEISQPVLVAMAGDARFAAAQLCPDWNETALGRVDFKTFSGFVDKIIGMTAEKLVAKYRITYEEAETACPALLAYVRIARAFKVEQLLIPKTSLRDGLLRETSLQTRWTESFEAEVVRSATSLAEKYAYDEKHARHVADLSVRIFQALRTDHMLDQRHELLLRVAALLHEVGGYVSSRSHHKHSMYLIMNSDLFGLTREDVTLVALVARYHRRALPGPRHPEYMMLDRDHRVTVSKMAAILRVADALDRNHLEHIRDLSFAREREQFVITVDNVEDLTVERLAVKEKGNLFEEVYGIPVVLREGRMLTSDATHA